jgi:hypothetical protein
MALRLGMIDRSARRARDQHIEVGGKECAQALGPDLLAAVVEVLVVRQIELGWFGVLQEGGRRRVKQKSSLARELLVAVKDQRAVSGPVAARATDTSR